MPNSCRIRPCVIDPVTHEEIESPLFIELEGLLGSREEAMRVYTRVTNQLYLANFNNQQGSSMSKYGEPKLMSLLFLDNSLKNLITQDMIADYLKKQYGFVDEHGNIRSVNIYHNASLLDKACELNSSELGSYVLAYPVLNGDMMHIEVEPSDKYYDTHNEYRDKLKFYNNFRHKIQAAFKRAGADESQFQANLIRDIDRPEFGFEPSDYINPLYEALYSTRHKKENVIVDRNAMFNLIKLFPGADFDRALSEYGYDYNALVDDVCIFFNGGKISNKAPIVYTYLNNLYEKVKSLPLSQFISLATIADEGLHVFETDRMMLRYPHMVDDYIKTVSGNADSENDMVVPKDCEEIVAVLDEEGNRYNVTFDANSHKGPIISFDIDNIPGRSKVYVTYRTSVKGDILKIGRKAITEARSLWDRLYEITLDRQHKYDLRQKQNPNILINDAKEITKQQELVLHFQNIARDFDNSNMAGATNVRTGEKFTKDSFRLESIILTLETAMTDLNRLKNLLWDLYRKVNDPAISLSEKCNRLNIINDYINSYSSLIQNSQEIIAEVHKQDNIFINVGEEGNEVQAKLYDYIDECLTSIEHSVRMMSGYGDVTDYGSKERRKNLTKDQVSYFDVAQPLHMKMLQDIIPEGAILRLNGEVTDLKTLSKYFNDDLGMFNLWLSSLANTPDDLLKLYDQVIKEASGKSRQEVNDIANSIIAFANKLEQGTHRAVRTHDFMFVKDDKGAPAIVTWKDGERGRMKYVADVDYDEFRQAREEFKQEIKSSPAYRSLPSREEKYLAIVNGMQKWEEENTEVLFNHRRPRRDLYATPEWEQFTDDQKKFYDSFMTTKANLDKYIGLKPQQLFDAIVIRKDASETWLKARSVKSWLGGIWDKIAGRFSIQSTDEGYGITNTLVDSQGNPIKQLPIYYRTTLDANKDTTAPYSLDCATALIMYANMAVKYKNMGEVANKLEMAKSIFNKRQSLERNGSNVITKNVYHLDHKFNDFVRKNVHGAGLDTRIDKMLDMQVYGQFRSNKSIGKLSVDKAAGLGQFIIALATLAVNVPASIANVLQGMYQTNIELAAGQYFKRRNFAKGQAAYWAHILHHIAEVGSPYKHSYMSLMFQKFNAMQDFESQLRENALTNKIRPSKMLSFSSLYILNHIGEHFLQGGVFCASCKDQMFLRADGKVVSMWDIYEKVENDPHNRKAGSHLELKPYMHNGQLSTEYTYLRDYETIAREDDDSIPEHDRVAVTEDGVVKHIRKTERKRMVSMKELDERAERYGFDKYDKRLIKDGEIGEWEVVNRVSRKSAKINQDMHGIYNEDDMSALQQQAWAKLIIMYRKFIMPNLTKRVKQEGYDFDLKADTEGIDRTMLNILFDAYRALRGKARHWPALSRNEKANLLRYIYTLASFILNTMLANRLIKFGWDDDEDDWLKQYAVLLAYRAKAEKAMWTPISFLPFDFINANPVKDWFNLLDSPVIGMNIIEGLMDVVMLASNVDAYNMRPDNLQDHTKTDFEEFDTDVQKGLERLGYDAKTYNKLKEDERRTVLRKLPQGDTYIMKAIKSTTPVFAPLRKSLNPQDQANYMQRQTPSDQVRMKKFKMKFKDTPFKFQDALRAAGWKVTHWNENLSTPERRAIYEQWEKTKQVPPDQFNKQKESTQSEDVIFSW